MPKCHKKEREKKKKTRMHKTHNATPEKEAIVQLHLTDISRARQQIYQLAKYGRYTSHIHSQSHRSLREVHNY